jgi:hypothetical protein
MKTHLTNLIISFLEDSLEQFNKYQTVDKNEYFKISDCLSLFKNEFDTEEKHKYLFRFINQPHRTAEKYLFEKAIINGDLDECNFLRMNNYLLGIKDWINK